ncbi:alpha/beta-hydrolase [Thelephora ganbajun]|uniref:Alpha/beta-hydrolase n=1 Tax=Thelephora ganbajun TaxID=370292 RepID=A0ACB6YZB3_THEGA|nr:alpha/beta-hydrolase [Thelephora ganbajun]
MIGTTLFELIFIRITITLLRLVAPLSPIYLVVEYWRGTLDFASPLTLYALLEFAFFALVYLPRKSHLQKPAKHPVLTREQRKELFNKCINPLGSEDIHAPSAWFNFVPVSLVNRDNFVEWLYWAIFSSTVEDGEEFSSEVEEYLEELEQRGERELVPGHDPMIKPIRVTLDPVHTTHRPLVWYLLVALVDTFSFLILCTLGFKHHNSGSIFHVFPPRPFTIFSNSSPVPLPYWYRPHRSNTKSPVLFLHGIGIGLQPYLPFIRELSKEDPDLGIIIVEILPICNRITRPPLDREATCLSISQILATHNLDRVVIVAHSFGTAIASYMLQHLELSQKVTATLLVDPITFLLHHPSVAYNFLYRTPKRANEWQLWYFASRDPDIARMLGRHFFWNECIMWKEDLDGGKRLAVVLSEEDQIVNAKAVRKYLTGEEGLRWEGGGLEVVWYPGLDHATVWDTKERREPMLEIVRRFTITVPAEGSSNGSADVSDLPTELEV